MNRRRKLMVLGGEEDKISPTIIISSSLSSPTETTPIPVTFTFSEIVTGFEVGDITVGNGSTGDFAGSGSVYTANITPIAGGAVTIDVDAGVCVDKSGNENEAATQYSITFYDVKINDTFTDVDTTALSAHTISPTNIPSSTWTNINTATGRGIKIQSNRATGNLNVPDNIYGLETGQTDLIVSVVFNLNLSTVVNRVIVRMDNLTDITASRYSWQIRFGNSLIQIYEHVSDANGTLVESAAATTTAATDYTIRVVVVGTSISVYVDGVLKLTHTMATHLTSTNVGIQLGSNATLADDFKVFF